MPRFFVSGFVLLLALALAGCSSTTSAPRWIEPVHTQNAAFLWKHSGGTLMGDASITYDLSGHVMIRLSKNLPSPLLETVSTAQGQFSASGPLSGGGWTGPANRVPVRFSLWQALSEAWRGAIPARDGRQEVHTSSYRAAVWKENGRVRELSVSSTDNGEMVRLVFR